jgi:hypothetical protein
MNEPHEKRSDRQLQLLRELLAEHASIDCDVFAIAKDTWVIHGVFPYDGQVPMAVFDTYDEATQVLEEVRRTTLPPSDL